MGWVAFLQQHIVALDTSPLIYYIETNPNYIHLVDPFFDAVDRGEIQVVTSTISLVEVLVHPLRQGNVSLAQQYQTLLSNTRGFSVMPVSPTIAQAAAHIRATYNLKTPDAIQIATSLEVGASFFVTNDPVFRRVPGIKVVVLDDLLFNSAGTQLYTVKAGDTLRSIARDTLGSEHLWSSIFNANRNKVSSPDHLNVGQQLIIL
jgi:predicted nucleic acid-binding protein